MSQSQEQEKNQDTPTTTAVPLAVVGMGCLFPGAQTPEMYWSNIRSGKDSITDIPSSHWSPKDYFDADKNSPDMTYAQRGAFLDPVDFNALEFGISPNNLEATDTTQLLGLVATLQALKDAGYSTGKNDTQGRAFNRDRTSVILGVTGTLELVIPLGARLGHPIWRKALRESGVDPKTVDQVVQKISDAYVPWQENSFPGLLGNVAAGRIANRFDLGGTNCVVDAACASSLGAIHLAAMELACGRADMVISGGLDTFNDIFMYMCFSKTPALSPTGNSRPFSNDADGTILGEGLGVVVLKRLADAQRDGDHIRAIIRSIGSSSDGRGSAVYAPRAEGQIKALRNAYEIADVEPNTIELIEAHGTGTKVGDATEIEALAEVYRESQSQGKWAAIGSVKSMIGHTKAAAGIAGMMKTILALESKVLPPSIKVDQPLPIISDNQTPVYLNTQSRPWLARSEHPRRAALSAFGFGGSNYHCVLEEATSDKALPDYSTTVQIFTFSANTKVELVEQIGNWETALSWEENRVSAALMRNQFSVSHKCRCLFVVQHERTDINKLKQTALQYLKNSKPDETFWNHPLGIYYGWGASTGSLALLFPGQGAQRVGMLRDLACQFPAMLDELQNADAAFGEPAHGNRLSDHIYPIPAFQKHELAQQEQQLRETHIAQPAVGAVSLGAARMIESFGLPVHAAAGHSFGELTALCFADCFDSNTHHHLAQQRGCLMSQFATGKGAMSAVWADPKTVQSMLNTTSGDVVIANHNSPNQTVISGPISSIEQVETLFSQQNIKYVRLPVSGAFHSSMLNEAEQRFIAVVEKSHWQWPEIAVYSNTNTKQYPQNPSDAKQIFASQITQPVRFVEQITNMYNDGIRTFVEVGPGKTLSGLVDAILENKPHHTVTLDASKGKRSGEVDLATLLAHTSALGYYIQWELWDPSAIKLAEELKNRKSGVSIKLCGANYVKPRQTESKETQKTPTPEKTIKPTSQQKIITKVKPTNTPNRLTSNQPQNSELQPNQHSPKPMKQEQPPEMKQPMSQDKIQTEKPSPITTLSSAITVTQQAILAFQKMQEQTAQLHQQYLQTQQTAQETLLTLIQQQQRSGNATPIQPIQTAPISSTDLTTSAPPVTQQTTAAQPNPTQTSTASQPTTPVIQTPVVSKPSLPTPLQSEPVSQQPTTNINIESILLEVVAEKTGYPTDMLELDMNIDSDLGIDSIKRVEILSEIQERIPDAPEVKPDDLGRLQTLREIVQFLTVSETVSSAPPRNTQPVPPTEVSDEPVGQSSVPQDNFIQQQSDQSPNVHNSQSIATLLIKVVAEKTGYPVDMLELEMHLDTDLGIDSIKRVEIFSDIQQQLPNAPEVKPEDLGTLQTLGQVVDFLTVNNATPNTKTDSASDEKTAQKKTRDFSQNNLNSENISHKPLLTLAVATASLSATDERTRLHLAEGEIWICDSSKDIDEVGYDLAEQLCERFKTVGKNAKLVSLDAMPEQALDNQPQLSALIIIAPVTETEDYALRAFSLIQRCGTTWQTFTDRADFLLVGITRLGGNFGITNHPSQKEQTEQPIAPHTAALAGIIKTANHEWPNVNCKVIDIPCDVTQSSALHDNLVDELTRSGPLEVGISSHGLIKLELIDHQSSQNSATEFPSLSLDNNSVVVLSGGARGVTASVAEALAKTYQPTLLLLGRSSIDQPFPTWVGNLSEAAEIKQAIIQNTPNKITPMEVEQQYKVIRAQQEIQQTIDRCEAAGSRVIYLSVDVRDAQQVQSAIEHVRNTVGPIAGVVHAAGVLADRLILDKTSQQFQQVYETKISGAKALFNATATDELKFIALFSSSTARFGRTGQVDYAAANEVLNKLAHQQANRRPHCKVVSFNWGPWDGGMVNDGLKKLFAAEGVDVIPLASGADYLLQEIASPIAGPIEIVVLGPDSHLPEEIHLSKTIPQKQTITQIDTPPQSTNSSSNLHLTFQQEVSLATCPILTSHVMNEKAVVPLALIIQWLSHAALHDNPGMTFMGFDNLKVFKGITLEEEEVRTLDVYASLPQVQADVEFLDVQLRSGKTLHAGARILLATEPVKNQSTPIIHQPDATTVLDIDEYYASKQLFHGPELQAIQQILSCSATGIVVTSNPAPPPSTWILNPLRSKWIADPLVIDAAFQAMILWSLANCSQASLPTAVGEYRQSVASFPAGRIKIMAEIINHNKHSATANIQFFNEQGEVIAEMKQYECVIEESLLAAFSRNQLKQQIS